MEKRGSDPDFPRFSPSDFPSLQQRLMAKYVITVECYETVSLGLATPREVSSVIDMYSYYLKEQKPEFQGIGKIILVYSDKDDLDLFPDVVKVTFKQKEGSENNIWNLERSEYLKTYHKKLIEYILSEGGDVSKFNKAFEIVESKNFIFDEIWKVKKWNPSRNAVATIEWHFSDVIDIYFLISYKNGDQKRYFISSLSSGLGVLDFCLGGLRWIDNDNVILVQSNKRDHWQLSLIDEKVDFYFHRAESGDAHGQYDLGMMYANGSSFLKKDLQKSLHWLRKSAENGYGRAINQLSKREKSELSHPNVQ